MAEEYVVKAPLFGTQHTGNAHLATHGDVGQTHATAGRIPRGPGFSRARIRCMTVGAQRLTVGKCMGQRRQHLLAIGAHQFGGHGGRGDFHQNDVIKSYAVEGVFQGNDALNLVSHDHRFQHITNRQRCFSVCRALLREVIGHRENCAEVVRRMPPLGGEPGVVVVEPAHDAADIPRRFHRIKAIRGARDASAKRHDGAFDDGAKVLGAFGKTQRQQTATQRVHQAVAGGVQGFGGFNVEGQDVVGDVLQDTVVVGAVVQVDVGAHVRFTL